MLARRPRQPASRNLAPGGLPGRSPWRRMWRTESSDPPAAVLRSARFSVLRGHIGTT